MNKQKLKNLLKIGILSFGIFILLWNCQNDETLEQNHESIENNTSEFSRVSINDLIQTDNTFSKLSNTYIPTTLRNKNTSAKNSSNSLIITSDTINIVEKENYKSYTLRIKRDGYEFDTENLIIEQNNGIETAYILSYDFDNDYVVDLINEVHSPPKGTVYYSKFDTSNLSSKTSTAKSSRSCQYLTITITAPCGCGHYIRSQCSGCSHGNRYPTSYTHRELICGESSGGGREIKLGGPLPTNDDGFGGSGGGGGSSPTGGNNSNTNTNLEDMSEFVEFKINKLIKNLKLNTAQAKWVGKNIQESLELYDFVAKDNKWSSKAIEFSKQAIALDRILEKSYKIGSTHKLPSELSSCCPGDCCPDVSLYENDRIVYEYGIQPVVAFIDGSFNLIIGTSELIGSDAWVGSRIRKMMLEIGIDVPADIDNEHLSELYRIRKRDNVVIVEYRPGLLKSMLDVGLDTLDVLAFLSPAKGGGPILFAKVGGTVSITSISKHIRDITITSVKIDNTVNSLKSKAKYILDGTGEFKTVGGHHPLSKIAFKSDKFYDLKKAFSVSISKLDGIKVGIHAKITGQQNSLYSAFAKTGEVLTIEKMANIEIKAMVNSGVPEDIATGWVIKALEDLKAQGVKVITNIPWNGLN